MYRFTEFFGWCNLVVALFSLALFPWLEAPPSTTKHSLLSVVLLQVAVSGALVYASRQKIIGSKIADTIYPAGIASYVLFAVFAFHSFWHGA